MAPYEAMIVQVDSDAVLTECGPMRLTIRARRRGMPCIDLASRAGYKALEYLERVAACHRRLCRPHALIDAGPGDRLALRMLESVRRVGDHDLTPMAAVAGTIADAVADWVFDRGATRAVVENGGDIAVRLGGGESVTVGVRPSVTGGRLSHCLHLDARRSSWGIATSGLGGRSLTRGIASAVTAVAADASLADAAATAVANACFVRDGGIYQLPAEQIDPATDLGATPVTVGVGVLPTPVRAAAVQNALERAERLTGRNVIVGALVALDDITEVSRGLECYVSSLTDNHRRSEAAIPLNLNP